MLVPKCTYIHVLTYFIDVVESDSPDKWWTHFFILISLLHFNDSVFVCLYIYIYIYIYMTTKMVKSAWASIIYILHQLEPDIRRLECLYLKILQKKQFAIFNETCLDNDLLPKYTIYTHTHTQCIYVCIYILIPLLRCLHFHLSLMALR